MSAICGCNAFVANVELRETDEMVETQGARRREDDAIAAGSVARCRLSGRCRESPARGNGVVMGAEGLKLLVAMEPRSYREAIGTFLRSVRAPMKVSIVDPNSLDAELVCFAPDLVFSSRPNPSSARDWPAWLEFHSGGYGQSVTLYLDGEYSEIHDTNLEDLLWVVDRTGRLLAASTNHGGR